MAAKRTHATMNTKAEDDDPVPREDELEFVALGGGNEVGRSCHIFSYKGKTVMLDAGIHPAYDGLAALPFYDEYDLGKVDLLLITHFHMDHAASLPYVLAKTNFKGKCFMTHPTKAIYKHLMQDSVRVQNTRVSTSAGSGTDGYVDQLFDEQDVLETLSDIQTISFNTTHSHAGIKFTPYPAGHVLGACMYLIEIAGLNVLFTGDYSRENNRHLIPATVPRNVRVDCLITESTFGLNSHNPRHERENRLLKLITEVLRRDGRALMPVFALGGAQEILLILEDYWERHKEEMEKYPIYFASSLARKCMIVYQTYIDSMNENIRSKFQEGQLNPDGSKRGPWDFTYVRSLKSLERFEDVGPCVMLASPGMLQNGVSRSLLERWAPDSKNGVIFTGYSVEGTMARSLLNGAIDAIPAVMTNRNSQNSILGKRAGGDAPVMIPRRCTVSEETFAAHVGGDENRQFIEDVNAPVVILVHGEKHAMGRLKSRLVSMGKFKVYNPANCEEIRIPFRQDKVARVVGRLANEVVPAELLPTPPLSDGDEADIDEGEDKKKKQNLDNTQVVSGVLVQNDYKLQLMAPEDLKEYAGLTTTTILCRERLTLPGLAVDLIKWALEGAFGDIGVESHSPSVKKEPNGTTNGNTPETADEEYPRQETTTLDILGGSVRVICSQPSGQVDVEWEGNLTSDGIADATICVIMGIESSPAAVRQSSSMHNHNHDHEEETERKPTKSLALPVREDKKLDLLFWFLEMQLGEGAVRPIAVPGNIPADLDEGTREKAIATELARLHGLGIPVPGLEVVEKRGGETKSVAKIWLENLEVDCANKTMKARLQALMERGVEAASVPAW